MSEVTTTRPIDLWDLATKGLGTLDAPAALSMSDDGTTRTITCHDDTVTQAQLEAAIEAHVPAPPTPSFDARIQAQVDETNDLLMEMMMKEEGV